MKKYLDLDIESMVCYHGGLSKVNINDQMQKIINIKILELSSAIGQQLNNCYF
ncbi:hypothetical protein J22TS1_46660 [Siminovitchia terrae]|nr:hypothetical protein J22TS1_46660 [Siminovitchia terrae]